MSKVDPNRQEGGRHYKGMGPHEPWEVLRTWLSAEEYRGYMKGSMIIYLARERMKAGDQDLKKAAHYAAKLVEVIEEASRLAPHRHSCVFASGCIDPGHCNTLGYCKAEK